MLRPIIKKVKQQWWNLVQSLALLRKHPLQTVKPHLQGDLMNQVMNFKVLKSLCAKFQKSVL